MSKKLREHLERRNQPEYDLKYGDKLEIMEIKETEQYNKLIKKQDGCRSQKDTEFKVFFKAKPIYLKKRAQIDKQREKIINYFVSLRDANPKELALTQKNILNRIEIILDYIENSRTKDRKQDQKAEDKKKERHGGKDSDKQIKRRN